MLHDELYINIFIILFQIYLNALVCKWMDILTTAVHTKIRTLLSNKNEYNTNKHNVIDWYQITMLG